MIFLSLSHCQGYSDLTIARLNEQLCFALYSASNSLMTIYRNVLEPIDITYTQFIVLMALWEEDNVSISKLASKTGLTKPTMTPLLKRLEEKELLVRKITLDNERQKTISLTQQGWDLSLQSKSITEEAFCLTKLSKKQARDLIDICRQLVNLE